jgi:hypothetical protein
MLIVRISNQIGIYCSTQGRVPRSAARAVTVSRTARATINQPILETNSSSRIYSLENSFNMDFSSNPDIAVFVTSYYVWLATALTAVLYYTSLPQAPVYGSFQRVGGTIFRWTAVHDVVANGYKNVSIVPPARLIILRSEQIIKPSNKPIVVRWWARDYLIMPARYLADLRTSGWSHLHFFRNISDALFLYTTVDNMYTSPLAERMVDVVKKGLNPRLRKNRALLYRSQRI